MFKDIVHGNVAFMTISIVLVFFMTPGLAFFYGGLVEKKHTLTLMLEIFISIGVVTLMWIFGGFSLVFGNTIGGFIGNPFQFINFKNILFKVNTTYGLTIPFLMFFMYQLMFAIITLPLMTGSIVNRITIGAWLKFLVIWMILVYFPVAHWVWGQGFLSKMGFVDFAGGTVIHVSAAFSGLGALWVLGKRKIITNKKPFNMGLVAIGGGILMFGWFGFNAGGTLTAAGTAAVVITNTGSACASGMITWIIISFFKKKKFSFLDSLVGAIAGLATITPASGYVTPSVAMLIGVFAGIICYFAIKIPKRMQWDDTLDVWGVHGVGGLVGTILIGVFADKRINDISASFYQFKIQLLGALLVGVYCLIISFLIMKFLDNIFNIRVTEDQINKGLDASLLDEVYGD